MVLPLIISFAASASVILLASYITYRIAFHSPNKGQNNIYALPSSSEYTKNASLFHSMVQTFDEMGYERIRIKSSDGIDLSARYYHNSDASPLAICCHGYRSTSVRDFCGGAKMLFEHGLNVLLIDQRSHGQSGGSTITFGIKERYDCLDWINYSIGRFGNDMKIMLYGLSMGGTTVLMACGLALPKNVVSVLADCPYSSPGDIIKKVMKNDMKLPLVLYPAIYLGALIFGRFRLNETTACESVKNSTIPIVIIHGEADSFVPCEMSEQIYESNKKMITRYTFPNADHGLSYITDTERYRIAVDAFIKKSIG